MLVGARNGPVCSVCMTELTPTLHRQLIMTHFTCKHRNKPLSLKAIEIPLAGVCALAPVKYSKKINK